MFYFSRKPFFFFIDYLLEIIRFCGVLDYDVLIASVLQCLEQAYLRAGTVVH